MNENNKKTFKEKIKEFLTWDYSNLKNDIFAKNEAQANKIAAIAAFNCFLLVLVLAILSLFNVYHLGKKVLNLLLAGVEFLVPAIYCFAKKGQGKNIKYYLIAGISLGLTVFYIYGGILGLLIMVLPIIIASRYFSRKFVWFSTGVVSFMLIVGSVVGLFTGQYPLSLFVFPEDTTLFISAGQTINESIASAGVTITSTLVLQTIFRSALPNVFVCLIFGSICGRAATEELNNAKEEIGYIEQNTQIESELNLATEIQANILPRIFPPFPDRKEFDIYAIMNPAKEVGGDFYDFFMVDDTHVAIVIGDVSGKGVPAALFMMTAKTLIKDHAQLGDKPRDVLTIVNKILAEGDDAGLFVTGWLGILDLQNHILTYSNAGHNPPLLKVGQNFQYLSSPAGFVLAGLEFTRYKEQTIKFEPGSRILLYTDGVTEAMNPAKELYGEERFLKYVNEHKNDSIKELVDGVRNDVARFSDGADQADDITMLLLDCKDYGEYIDEKVYDANDDALEPAQAHLDEFMEQHDVPLKMQNQIQIAFEEMLVNVCHYAYAKEKTNQDVHVSLDVKDDNLIITIRDHGFAFNPLERKDPDITGDVADRQVGGLGIYMAKKIMDDMTYEYKYNMNILTMTKKIK